MVEINRFGDAHQDTDPPGDSPGDESFSEDPVFDAQNRKRVGHKLTLNSFPGGHRVLFTGALALRDGTITLGGVFVNGKPDRAEVGDRFVADGAPVGAFGVHGVLEVAGGQEDAGVDDEGVAVRLRGLVFVVGVAGGSAVGEEDEAPQVVERLAAVELPPDSPAERFVGEPAQGVKRPQETPSVRNRRAR